MTNISNMSKIRIKNFGPIKDGYLDNGGWMDIKKVTLFIGDQGSGKSTVAKLISSFCWFEKALNRGDYNDKDISEHSIIELLAYQGVKNYLTDNTEVEFAGNAYTINFSRSHGAEIRRRAADDYVVPKIMYVPAERNFLSTIKSAYDVKGLPGPLTTFAEELKRANIDLEGVKIDLPIRDYSYRYDHIKDISYIHGPNYMLNLLEASSGLQSLIPLYLVSRSLVDAIVYSDDISRPNVSVNQTIRMEQELNKINRDPIIYEEEKEIRRARVKARFYNKCFINIVEETEQNLFPTSQRAMLNSLLKFNNTTAGNKLTLATHSPYIIIYLSLAIQGDELKKKILTSDKASELLKRLNKIVPEQSTTCGDDVVIYEIKEGKIIRLPNDQGIPSDKNYLNQSLAEGNLLFDSLLAIEQEL